MRAVQAALAAFFTSFMKQIIDCHSIMEYVERGWFSGSRVGASIKPGQVYTPPPIKNIPRSAILRGMYYLKQTLLSELFLFFRTGKHRFQQVISCKQECAVKHITHDTIEEKVAEHVIAVKRNGCSITLY